jgi:protein SFI1
VLPRHGLVADEDVHHYRTLLRMSLHPEPDWWRKFEREVQAAAAAEEEAAGAAAAAVDAAPPPDSGAPAAAWRFVAYGSGWRSSCELQEPDGGARQRAASSGSPALAAALGSGRHSPAFREGAAAAAVAALRPASAAAAAAAALARAPAWVHAAAVERPGGGGRPRPSSAGPATAWDPAAPPGAEAVWAPRSPSCSLTLGRRPLQGAARRSSVPPTPARGGPAVSFDSAPGRALEAAPGRSSVLAAPGAAAERQRRAADKYAAFARRLPLFAVWREHAAAAGALRCVGAGARSARGGGAL